MYKDIYLIVFFIWIGSEDESNLSEIFRPHIADLSNAITSDLYRVTDRLFAKNLIGQGIQQSTTIEAIPDYCKASKLVYELYKQLQDHNDPKQYLTKICNILLKLHDQRLTDIVNNIKAKL